MGNVSLQTASTHGHWLLAAGNVFQGYNLPTFAFGGTDHSSDSFLHGNVVEFTPSILGDGAEKRMDESQCGVTSDTACNDVIANSIVESGAADGSPSGGDHLEDGYGTDIPEPSSVALVGLALLAAGVVSKRRA